ncbi:hypothetical protein NDU88_008763 [Pleurodeles waltl]|uniref:Uncharacterized protein n=1 Tax=Pleurodeles waltl TaxID=8319 RepID=A0AAV7NXI1_PLEWA|nr:hypothetical protein NDU88_008763 [Pleurodeles waltl]
MQQEQQSLVARVQQSPRCSSIPGRPLSAPLRAQDPSHPGRPGFLSAAALLRLQLSGQAAASGLRQGGFRSSSPARKPRGARPRPPPRSGASPTRPAKHAANRPRPREDRGGLQKSNACMGNIKDMLRAEITPLMVRLAAMESKLASVGELDAQLIIGEGTKDLLRAELGPLVALLDSMENDLFRIKGAGANSEAAVRAGDSSSRVGSWATHKGPLEIHKHSALW